jgi:hypothetical protein
MSVTLVAALLGLCGILIAAMVLGVRRGTAQAVSRVEDLESKLESVDLLAFQNLIDPEERRLLQERLSPRVYRRMQRLRTRAAIAYVEAVYRNAGLTIRLAEHLSRSPQPEIREEAMRIQALSIRSRFLALNSLIRLNASLVFPAFTASLREVTEGYTGIADRVEALCTLTAPLHTSRIAAAFR